jgi:hypothetical protein
MQLFVIDESQMAACVDAEIHDVSRRCFPADAAGATKAFVTLCPLCVPLITGIVSLDFLDLRGDRALQRGRPCRARQVGHDAAAIARQAELEMGDLGRLHAQMPEVKTSVAHHWVIS